MGIISFFKAIFSTDYTVDNSKVYFTPFGISDVSENFRKKEFSTDKLKVLSIVEINKHTDIYSLIYAVNLCNMEGMNIELDFFEMGDISKRDLKKLENELKRLNCSNIHFKGSIQNERETVHLYPQYDVYASVYYSVDSRLFTVEAMRAKLPLILTDIKEHNISEFIRGNGSIIPNHAVNFYYETLKSFYSNKSQLMTMGQNSRKLYEEEFTIKPIVNKTINIYREALEV